MVGDVLRRLLVELCVVGVLLGSLLCGFLICVDWTSAAGCGARRGYTYGSLGRLSRTPMSYDQDYRRGTRSELTHKLLRDIEEAVLQRRQTQLSESQSDSTIVLWNVVRVK